jgi:hypothetical protein
VSSFIVSSCDPTLSKLEDSRRTVVVEQMQSWVRVDHSTQMQQLLALSSLKNEISIKSIRLIHLIFLLT